MNPRPEHQYQDLFGRVVGLTAEVRDVVFAKHPEVRRFFDRVAETLAIPELVKMSVSDTRVDLYYRFYQDVFGGKYLVVVVKHLEHMGHSFVSTI